SEDPNLTAVVEPDLKHTVTVLDVRDGKVEFTSSLDNEDADGLSALTLVTDRDHVYLALQRAPDSGVHWSAMVSPGVRTVRTNGALYALNRSTGHLEWVCPELDHQVLILEQSQDLPLLLFAATVDRSASNGV